MQQSGGPAKISSTELLSKTLGPRSNTFEMRVKQLPLCLGASSRMSKGAGHFV